MFRILIICGLLMSGDLSAGDIQAVLDWSQRVELSTLVDGMVSRVNVKPGAAVARGSLLVELDQRGIQARLAWAEAQASAAKQLQAEARRELNRSLDLYDRTLLSDHERKQAEIGAAMADAQFRKAEAELTDIRLRRDYSRINAPFEGIVVEVHVHPGQALVNRFKPMPVVTLVADGMKAVAQVDSVLAAELKAGDAVKVGVRGEWFEGKINQIGLEPSKPAGADYALEVLLTPPDNMQLRAGEPVVVRIDE